MLRVPTLDQTPMKPKTTLVEAFQAPALAAVGAVKVDDHRVELAQRRPVRNGEHRDSSSHTLSV